MLPNVPPRQQERHDYEGRENLDERITDIGVERTGIDGASRVGDLLCNAIRAERITHQKSPLSRFVTASFGVAAVVPDGLVTAATLIASADQALYEAKHAGRNRVACNRIMLTGPA